MNYGDLIAPTEVNLIGYSGIITKSKSDFRSLYNLTNEEYLSKDVIVMRDLDIRNFSLLRKNTSDTRRVKILNFGNDIYGYVCKNDNVITIINTMSNTLLTNHQKVTFLNELAAASNGITLPDTVITKDTVDTVTFNKMLNLSFITILPF